MGAWIALLLAKAIPHRVCGMVGIASTPDFTKDVLWERLAEEQRAILCKEGRLAIP